MAVNWIKVEVATPDKPEIILLSVILGIDQDAAFGKCVRLWMWADQQSEDGNALSVTLSFIDRYTNCTGFGKALIKVGWLSGDDGCLSLPNFLRHNGTSSKKRALGSKRQDKFRNAVGVTSALLDKNRLDKSNTEEVASQKKKVPKEDPAAVPIPDSLDTPAFKSLWTDWIADRGERQKKLTARAAKQQLNKLSEIGHDRAIAAITHSIASGYQGIYEPNGNGRQPAKQVGRVDAPAGKYAHLTGGGDALPACATPERGADTTDTF